MLNFIRSKEMHANCRRSTQLTRRRLFDEEGNAWHLTLIGVNWAAAAWSAVPIFRWWCVSDWVNLRTYTGWSKKTDTLCFVPYLYALISSHIDRFSNLFYCLNLENICNNIVAKDPTTPQVCRYTTSWNLSVLKATTENKTSSVTTHFKKLTTGNNVFILSVII